MRISDWSSDVCSSDLFGERLVAALPSLRHADDPRNLSLDEAAKLRSIICLDQPCPSYLVSAADALDAGDRKSVVEGKSVSVRVDLGGRRIIKKKKLY